MTVVHPTATRRRLITPGEAAAILSVAQATVVMWAAAGRFPAILYCTAGQPIRYRFAREDILAFRDRTLARARSVQGRVVTTSSATTWECEANRARSPHPDTCPPNCVHLDKKSI